MADLTFGGAAAVGSSPRPELAHRRLDARPLPTRADKPVAGQVQHIAAEVGVVDAHTDGLELDVMV